MLGLICYPDNLSRENIDKLRGIVLTHGHEDYIGALPYVCEMSVYPFTEPGTLGLVGHRPKEHGILKITLSCIKAGW